jgi:formylglycine-generating enzyme
MGGGVKAATETLNFKTLNNPTLNDGALQRGKPRFIEQPNIELLNIERLNIALAKIPAGSFTMGSEAYTDSLPLTEITFAHDFYMGQYTVTQQLWKEVMGDVPNNDPSRFKGGQRPVEQVSWDDICQPNGFLDKLNQMPHIVQWLKTQKLASWAFRLPSEAEWEYAARGGPDWQAGFEYAGSNDIDEVAWYDENSHQTTQPVGLKAPNQLGLYDMSGNVWEWCADDWIDNYNDMPGDGRPWIKKPERARNRVLRGGGYFGSELICRPGYRYSSWPDGRNRYIGFRLVLAPQFSGLPLDLTPIPSPKGEGQSRRP